MAKTIEKNFKKTNPSKKYNKQKTTDDKTGDGKGMPAKGKRIQKSSKPSELQSHYQSIVINIKKKGKNLENLNKAITNFIVYYKANAAMVPKKALGAKALQLCLKYGTSSHRDTIILLLLQKDFVALCKSSFGGFIINKVFIYAEGTKSMSVVKKFFRQNFASMVSVKENLMALSSFINNMDEKTAYKYLGTELAKAKFADDYMSELFTFMEARPSLVKHSLIHYLSYYLFEQLTDEQKPTFLLLILKNLDETLIKNNHKSFIVVALIKFFLNVNFKNKKEIIKKILKDKFLEYYLKHGSFMFLLIAFLMEINDGKVINITILRAFKSQLEPFFENVSIAKLLETLMSGGSIQKLRRDPVFRCNPAIRNMIDIDSLPENTVFSDNLSHISNEIVNEPELLAYLNFDNLKERSSDNSAFSLLFSGFISKMLNGRLKSGKSR